MSTAAHHAQAEPDRRDYENHRRAVIALLRARFGSAFGESDREDLYHEAWAAVLERRRRGQPTPDLLGLLKTIAWRRGRDRLRNLSADPIDPLDGALARALDRGPSPYEQVLQRLDADLCKQLVDSLSARQRAIVRLRCEWGLAPSEIQDALGISRKVYEKQLTRAHKRLAAQLGEVENGSWRERQRALLLACEAGTASASERDRAARLVENDPWARAMLRRMRGAAVLALPAIGLRSVRHAVRAYGGVGAAKLAACGAGISLMSGVAAGLGTHGDHRGATRAGGDAPRTAVAASAGSSTRALAGAKPSRRRRPRHPRPARASHPPARTPGALNGLVAAPPGPAVSATQPAQSAATQPQTQVTGPAAAPTAAPLDTASSPAIAPSAPITTGDGNQEFGP